MARKSSRFAIGTAGATIATNQLTINPTADLLAATGYYITIDSTAIKDAANNAFAGISNATTLNFNTQLTISAIQGGAHTSPYNGQSVTGIRGVVTAVNTSGTSGFYIQALAADQDADVNTSEGIFVVKSASGVAVGDVVDVAGIVQETGSSPDLTLTTINAATGTITQTGTTGQAFAAQVIGTGGRAPPTTVTDNDNFATFDPTEDGIDFWETMEGMWLQFNNVVSTGYTRSDGEFWILGDNGGYSNSYNAATGALAISGDDQLDDAINLADTSATAACSRPRNSKATTSTQNGLASTTTSSTR